MKNPPTENCVSMTKGFWFVFKDGNNEIVAGGSAFTGKEFVFFNKELIVQERSMKKTTKHVFFQNNNKYEVVFNVPEIMKGKIECSLYKNDSIIKRYKSHVAHKFSFKTLLVYIALGVAYGLISSIFKLPFWAAIIFLLSIVVLSVAKTMRRIVIEEF
jgi:hypothetical protein